MTGGRHFKELITTVIGSEYHCQNYHFSILGKEQNYSSSFGVVVVCSFTGCLYLAQVALLYGVIIYYCYTLQVVHILN